jgi:hypothetical protein
MFKSMHVKSGIIGNITPLTKKIEWIYSSVIHLADHVALRDVLLK